MKKLFISLILTFILLILSNVESNGQCSSCPSGYESKSFQATLPGSSCIVTFNVCVFCAPTGNPQVQFCNAYFPSSCFSNQVSAFDWFLMKKEVMGKILMDCETEIPPCSTMSKTASEYYEAACLIASFNGAENRIEFQPCNSTPGTCRTDFAACVEDDEIVIEITGGPTVTDTGDCGPAVLNLNPLILPMACFSFCF
jgi:hypothetical protein